MNPTVNLILSKTQRTADLRALEEMLLLVCLLNLHNPMEIRTIISTVRISEALVHTCSAMLILRTAELLQTFTETAFALH